MANESGELDSAIAVERFLQSATLFHGLAALTVYTLLRVDPAPPVAAQELFFMYAATASFCYTSSTCSRQFRESNRVKSARFARYITAFFLVVACFELVRELIIMKAFFTLAAIGLMALVAIAGMIEVRNEDSDYLPI